MLDVIGLELSFYSRWKHNQRVNFLLITLQIPEYAAVIQ